MSLGTKFYETIATNRKTAGLFTRPFKFRPLKLQSSPFLTLLLPLALLLLTTWLNLKSFVDQTVYFRREQPQDFFTTTHHLFNRRSFQTLAKIGHLTRLDQIWSIFAPGPPRDDGWHVVVGQLKDGSQVNVLQEGQPINWEKLTIKQRYELYPICSGESFSSICNGKMVIFCDHNLPNISVENGIVTIPQTSN